MKTLIALLFSAVSFSVAAQNISSGVIVPFNSHQRPPLKGDSKISTSKLPVAFDLDALPLSQAIRLIYIEAFKEKSFFLDPAVLNDQRPISFRYTPEDGDFRLFLSNFLSSVGYKLDRNGRTDFIRPLPTTEKPSAAEDSAIEIFYYRPKNRDGSYLIEALTPLFRGKFTAQRAIPGSSDSSLKTDAQSTPIVAPANSALAQISQNLDQLLFAGSSQEVTILKKLLPQLDTPIAQVFVSAAVYEVQTGHRSASALSIVGSLFGSHLRFGVGTAKPADNYLSIQIADLTAITQLLDTDNRFTVLSSPQVRVLSGRSATFTVGEQVPVLGAITYPSGSSSPVQSVDYRNSGVIFSINPEVRDATIDLKIDQQVSAFVNTTTGVNNSPTLTKREISTSVSLSDSDVIVIGGLRQEKDSQANSKFSFLPNWFDSKSADKNTTEILLFLQVKRITGS